MIPVMLAGTLSTQGIIRAQGGSPGSGSCSTTRPLSLPSSSTSSARSRGKPHAVRPAGSRERARLGYNTEYSGMRFSYFFLVEWGNMW